MINNKEINDVVLFMAAYDGNILSKNKSLLNKSNSKNNLFDKFHIDYLIIDQVLLSSKGKLNIAVNYDYIKQKSTFTFEPFNKSKNIEEYEEIIKKLNGYIRLREAHSVLLDFTYFKIDWYISMESFMVYICENCFQVDPLIFSINGTLIIAYEIIDFKTGEPLTRNDVLGKKGNFNFKRIDKFQYFDTINTIETNMNISEIVAKNTIDFFSELLDKKYEYRDFSFVYNTLIISNCITSISKYFCDFIGIREMPSRLKNISTKREYDYYPWDGKSVITRCNSNNIDEILYNAVLLESIKMYIFLFQIRNLDLIDDINDVMKNNLYLEYLFFAPNLPIETNNMFDFIYNSKSYQGRKQAIELKISYMKMETDTKRKRSTVLLNILLYIISLLSAISTLDTVEAQFSIPFRYSFIIVLVFFTLFGLIWVVREYKYNKKF